MRYGLIETDDVLDEVLGGDALDLEDTKLHVKAHSGADDLLFDEWVETATHDFQEETGRQVMTARRYYWLECFPIDRRIELPRPPLQEVEAVEYYNADGDLVSFEDETTSPATPNWIYHASSTDPHGRRGFVEVKDGYDWPTTQVRALAVRITYLCGYGDATENLPALIKSVLRAKVHDLDRMRGGSTSQPVHTVDNVQRVIAAFKYSALQTLVPRRCL